MLNMGYRALHPHGSAARATGLVAVVVVGLVATVYVSTTPTPQPQVSLVPVGQRCVRAAAQGRRHFMRNGLAAVALPAYMSVAHPRNSLAAFKFPGDKPKDLGVRDDGSLKGCPSTSNCWSTSAPDKSHFSSPFAFSKSKTDAIEDLRAVLDSYPKDGQKIDEKTLVDGGGWRMVKSGGGYFQLEYESKKFGFIDDVEFNVMDGKVTYRSASRQGDSDFGVNAYRLNFIAKGLQERGWNTPGFPLTTAAQR